MSKFIVIKKNTILIFLITIFFLFLFINLSIKNSIKISKATLNTLHNSEYFDFDADGLFDSVDIISNNSSYSLKLKTSNSETLLKSSEFGYELLDVNPSCKIRVKYTDLSRDNIPEIIVSGIKNNIPTFYIFKWINGSFEEIFFSQKNILGILDYNNSRTPKILEVSSNEGDSNTESFLLTNGTLKNITYSKQTIPSLGIIQQFIDLIQLQYEITETPGLFTSYIPSEELGLLWNLDKKVYRYEYQYGYFFDSTWNNLANPTTIYWILSFKKINFIDSQKANTELMLNLKCELDELGEFKISSINKL